MCKRNSADKNKAGMGCVRETPHRKREREKKKEKRNSPDKKRKRSQHGMYKRNSLHKTEDSTGCV